MLSYAEKKELLADAQDLKRRDAFRQTVALESRPFLDAYVSFLNSLQDVFPRKKISALTPSQERFKL